MIVAVGFAAFVFVFASKNPTSTSQASIFGKQTLLVVSGSMEANDNYYKDKNYDVGKIKTGSLIFLKSAPSDSNKIKSNEYTAEFKQYLQEVNINDVITFLPQMGEATCITHRVKSKYEVVVDGHTKIRFETRGDVADSQGETKTEVFFAENIIGKVTGKSYALGWLYLNVFSNKILVVSIVIIVSGSVIGYEIYRIIRIVRQDKREASESKNIDMKGGEK